MRSQFFETFSRQAGSVGLFAVLCVHFRETEQPNSLGHVDMSD